jgi:hypothetical protein
MANTKTNIKNVLKTGLQSQVSGTEQLIEKSSSHLTALQEELANVADLDIDKVLFTVDIYDPWDNAGDTQCSSKATERGLKNAVTSAERQYISKANSLRKDQVLRYTVTARLTTTDLPVPDEVWLPYSQQKKDTISLKKGF